MRAVYLLLGGLAGALLAFGVLWLVGSLFGPFYDGEADMARNVKIVLGLIVAGLLVGGIVGNTLYTRRRRQLPRDV